MQFARSYVERLAIVVCFESGDPIPGELRRQWLKETFPRVSVHSLQQHMPEKEADVLRWSYQIRCVLPEAPGLVFGSNFLGPPLARSYAARFIPVDYAREFFPVPSEEILADPIAHWELLSPAARPHFVRRIAIVGAESTGKTRLARDLAAHFQTVYTSEYARGLVDFQSGQITFQDAEWIARGQLASEDALARHANRRLFCDTDTLTTEVYCDVIYGQCVPWIRDVSRDRRYDLTLLLDCDVPWEDDPQRCLATQEARQDFTARIRRRLEERERRYAVIGGARWDERLQAAIHAVEKMK